jgi:lipopolysaccharide export system permease protein
LTKIFVVSSVVFVTLMVMIGVADEAADNGLGPDIVLKLVPYILPKALMFAMPATSLFSICVVFGRMAADNELVALQSVGLRKSVVVVPALAATFMLSLAAVWVNDISFAWSYWGVERVVLESMDKIVYGMLENEGSFKEKDFSIEVDDIQGRRLIRPVITVNAGNGGHVRATAAEAELSIIPEQHSLNLMLVNGVVESEGKASMRFDDQVHLPIPLRTQKEIAEQLSNPSHLYMSQLDGEWDRQVQALERMKSTQAIQACSQLLVGDMLGLTTASWRSRLQDQIDAESRLGRLKLVPHRRWASGFSCLAFAVIGIPVAMRLRSANYATTFGMCFLPILIVYYPLFMFGLTGAKEGTLPPAAAWFANGACVLIGLWLLFRESRA